MSRQPKLTAAEKAILAEFGQDHFFGTPLFTSDGKPAIRVHYIECRHEKGPDGNWVRVETPITCGHLHPESQPIPKTCRTKVPGGGELSKTVHIGEVRPYVAPVKPARKRKVTA